MNEISSPKSKYSVLFAIIIFIALLLLHTYTLHIIIIANMVNNTGKSCPPVDVLFVIDTCLLQIGEIEQIKVSTILEMQ